MQILLTDWDTGKKQLFNTEFIVGVFDNPSQQGGSLVIAQAWECNIRMIVQETPEDVYATMQKKVED